MLVFGVDVSDPENPKYRAMQVDKYGRLVVSPEYLKLDGSNSPMTGTLTLGDIGSSPYYDLALKFGAADLGFRRYGTNLIQLVNAAGDLKNLQVSGLRARYVQSPANQNLEIQAYETGVGDLTIAKGIYGATPYFEISRCGDINFINTAPIIATKQATTSELNLQAWKLSSLTTVAKLVSHATDPYFRLLKSGQINFATGNEDIVWDSGDFIAYDTTNNRFIFYIGDAAVGYVDNTGFHDGSP